MVEDKLLSFSKCFLGLLGKIVPASEFPKSEIANKAVRDKYFNVLIIKDI